MAHKIRTFIESGPLIEYMRGRGPGAKIVEQLLADPDRQILTSPYIAAELLPTAVRERKPEQVKFLDEYLSSTETYTNLEQMFVVAWDELHKCNLGLADALHLAAAHLLQADEFWTTEVRRKPLHETDLVKVHYLPRR